MEEYNILFYFLRSVFPTKCHLIFFSIFHLFKFSRFRTDSYFLFWLIRVNLASVDDIQNDVNKKS